MYDFSIVVLICDRFRLTAAMDSTNDVYFYIDTLMEKLKDNLEDFQLIEDSLDKIEFVRNLLVENNLMPDYC